MQRILVAIVFVRAVTVLIARAGDAYPSARTTRSIRSPFRGQPSGTVDIRQREADYTFHYQRQTESDRHPHIALWHRLGRFDKIHVTIKRPEASMPLPRLGRSPSMGRSTAAVARPGVYVSRTLARGSRREARLIAFGDPTSLPALSTSPRPPAILPV